MLLKQPGFTLIAVITLALGIGANTVIFSVVNGVLLAPLPYRESDRLLSWWFSSPPGLPRYHLTQAHFALYRDQAQSFESLAAYAKTSFSLTDVGEPERLEAANVTVDFFRVFGQQMRYGRAFAPEEGLPGKNLVCVLSYGFWRQRFGGDPAIVGKTLNIQTMERTVAETLGARRLTNLLFVAFALTAFALAAVGIYGVMLLNVNQRLHEFGIRVALGARSRDLLRLVIGRGMWLALMGAGIGLLAAFALTRWLKTLLYGVSPTDPLTFSLIALLLITVSLLACWIPARRAAKVDPMIALRCE